MAKTSITELTFQIMASIIGSSKLESHEQVLLEAKEYANKIVKLNSPKEMVVASFEAIKKLEILTFNDIKDIRKIIDL